MQKLLKLPILICVLLFIFNLGVRGSLAAQFIETPYFHFTLWTVTGPDQNTFLEWGHAISEGQWEFRRLKEGEAFYAAPLYALLIALMFKLGLNPAFLTFLQVGLSSLLVFVFYDLGRLFRRPRWGLLAAGLWSLYGVSHYYDSCLIRASFFTSLSFLTCWSLIRAERHPHAWGWIRTGLFSGVLALLRPQLLFFLLPLWILGRSGFKPTRRRVKAAGLVALVSLLCVLPVTIRNYRASGEFVLIASQGADAFWLGNAPDVLGVSYFPSNTSLALRQESENNLAKSLPIFARELAHNPRAYLELYGRKLKMLLNDYEIPANYSYYVFERLLPRGRLGFLSVIWILGFAGLGLIYAIRSKVLPRDFFFFFWVLFFSALAIHIQSRYRFPLVPFVLFLSAGGLAGFFECVRQKRVLALGLAILLLCGITFSAQALPSYGKIPYQGEIEDLTLNPYPIRDVDYITMIAAGFLDKKGLNLPAVRSLVDEGIHHYGPGFRDKLQSAIEQLRS